MASFEFLLLCFIASLWTSIALGIDLRVVPTSPRVSSSSSRDFRRLIYKSNGRFDFRRQAPVPLSPKSARKRFKSAAIYSPSHSDGASLGDGDNIDRHPRRRLDMTHPYSAISSSSSRHAIVHPHTKFLYASLRGPVPFNYAQSPTISEFALFLDAEGNVQRSRRRYSPDFYAQEIMNADGFHAVAYNGFDQGALGYKSVQAFSLGGFSTVYHAVLSEPRHLDYLGRGMSLPAGTPIAVKMQALDLDKTYHEIEAIARLSWLSKYGITGLFTETYGVYFSRRTNILPTAPELRSENDLYPCAYIEMEWIQTTFASMNYHKMIPIGPGRYVNNTNSVQMPDSLVLEVMWGELMAGRYAHVSVFDGHPHNYAVKMVDYWRVYQFVRMDERTGRLMVLEQYAVPPSERMAKRIDYNFWHPYDGDHEVDESSVVVDGNGKSDPRVRSLVKGTDPVLNLRNEFPFMFQLSENAEQGINALELQGKNLRTVFRKTFAPFRVHPDWLPPNNQRAQVFRDRPLMDLEYDNFDGSGNPI